MGRVRLWLKRPVVISVLVVGALGLSLGVYWFQPWKLFVDETVRDALPVAVTPSAGQPAAADPQILASGTLISHEHDTSGSARIVKLADGSRILRLENLDTSNGPDLRVLLTDAPVKQGTAGWRVFDDGKHVSLGKLKGNKGDQNYALPRDLDLAGYTSVSIWCDRFDVSFGAAELARPA
ncbi:DM13 domain-containing protein [Streptomyces sp. NPDC029004]|uniref:DM13 domain-containing protein n=1 Tax=Streptomyces sp. NPDC029004 TaxID=3154490 RepID=UPI0033DA63CF